MNTGQGQQEGRSGIWHMEALPEIRVDVSAHGFGTHGMTAIFDFWVTDIECPSQCGSDPGVILKCHEVEKKRKYLAHCEHQHKHFTPLVFLVDGMMGVECDAASKRLASRLATKWKRMYSKMCGFVPSRLTISSNI
eukprot:scaffold30133_cov43-Attheya_sp.AAC.2